MYNKKKKLNQVATLPSPRTKELAIAIRNTHTYTKTKSSLRSSRSQQPYNIFQGDADAPKKRGPPCKITITKAAAASKYDAPGTGQDEATSTLTSTKLHIQSDAIEVAVVDDDVDEVVTHNGKNIQKYKGNYNNNKNGNETENKNGRKSFIHKSGGKARREQEPQHETPRTCAETTATTKEIQTNTSCIAVYSCHLFLRSLVICARRRRRWRGLTQMAGKLLQRK